MIKEIHEDLDIAISLVWRVFLEFEAPNYTKEGIEEFKRSINDKEWVQKKKFYGYYDNNKLVGVIATNNINHISLLFVDGNYHKMGIGRKLYNYIRELNNTGYFEVNSSIFGHEFYKRIGFVDTDTEQCVHGIRFFPMRLDFNEEEII
jgi:GNAT superfamily N-acetyltransferase